MAYRSPNKSQRRPRNTGSVFYRSSRASTRPWEARWVQGGQKHARMFQTETEALLFMDGFAPNSREAWLDLVREHLWFRLQWRYEAAEGSVHDEPR